MNYIKRIVDDEIKNKLSCMGAIYIRGIKGCGKTTSAKQIAKSVLEMQNPDLQENYIVYTDNTLDSEGNVKVYASIYEPDKENMELIPIESEREWKIVETILDSIQEENREKTDN